MNYLSELISLPCVLMMKGARQNEYCRDREEFWYLYPLCITHLGLLRIIHVVCRLILLTEVKKGLADCSAKPFSVIGSFHLNGRGGGSELL